MPVIPDFVASCRPAEMLNGSTRGIISVEMRPPSRTIRATFEKRELSFEPYQRRIIASSPSAVFNGPATTKTYKVR
jgi:hypothetical protein